MTGVKDSLTADLIDPEVLMIHRRLGIALLSDWKTVPVTNWLDADGECDPNEATACVCGPCSDGKWYSVDLKDYEGVIMQ